MAKNLYFGSYNSGFNKWNKPPSAGVRFTKSRFALSGHVSISICWRSWLNSVLINTCCQWTRAFSAGRQKDRGSSMITGKGMRRGENILSKDDRSSLRGEGDRLELVLLPFYAWLIEENTSQMNQAPRGRPLIIWTHFEGLCNRKRPFPIGVD